LRDLPHSRLPVANGSVEDIIGIVTARDLVAALIDGRPLDLRALARKAAVVPDQMDAMNALGVLRAGEVPVALVHDEYGHFEGIVTPADLLTAIAGGFASDADDAHDPPLVSRPDGSWLVSGSLAADIFAETLGIELDEDRDYATVAGLALAVLKRLPSVGDRFVHDRHGFEIVDMDGRKIDKLLVSPPS
jgi:putative hemolysin